MRSSPSTARTMSHRERVVARGHRRVRREHAVCAHRLDVRRRSSVVESPAAQLPLEQRQRQQRRVAFVHVVEQSLLRPERMHDSRRRPCPARLPGSRR